MRSLSSAFVMIMCGGQMAAAEFNIDDVTDPFVDVRIGVGVMSIPTEYTGVVVYDPPTPPPDDYINDTYSASRSKTVSFGLVGGWLNPLGPVLGLELVSGMTSRTIDARTGTIPTPVPAEPVRTQLRTFGPNLLAGFGYAPLENLHIEVLGVLGGGGLRRQQPNVPMTEAAASTGWYWDAGLRGGVYFNTRHFVIGGCLDATYIRMHDDSYWLGGTIAMDGKDFGVGGRLEIGYRIQ